MAGHRGPAWEHTAVKPGSHFADLLEVVRMLGGSVVVERGNNNVELFHRKATPQRIRITAKKEPRSEAPEHVVGWIHSLMAAAKRDDPRAVQLAVAMLNTKMLPLLDELLKDEERLEVERAGLVERQRLERIEKEKLHAARRRKEDEEMGNPHTEERIREKLRLRDLLLAEAKRLKLTPYDLGKLIDVGSDTIELWMAPNQARQPKNNVEQLAEWIGVLKSMPTPGAQQTSVAQEVDALHAKPLTLPPPAVALKDPMRSTISVDGDALLVVLAAPVAIDLRALPDVTLLGISHAVNQEMLRRARGGA